MSVWFALGGSSCGMAVSLSRRKQCKLPSLHRHIGRQSFCSLLPIMMGPAGGPDLAIWGSGRPAPSRTNTTRSTFRIPTHVFTWLDLTQKMWYITTSMSRLRAYNGLLLLSLVSLITCLADVASIGERGSGMADVELGAGIWQHVRWNAHSLILAWFWLVSGTPALQIDYMCCGTRWPRADDHAPGLVRAPRPSGMKYTCCKTPPGWYLVTGLGRFPLLCVFFSYFVW